LLDETFLLPQNGAARFRRSRRRHRKLRQNISSGAGVVRNVLDLKALRRADLGAELECRATNNHLVTPSVATVRVDMTRKQ
jgi:hypothetical protein